MAFFREEYRFRVLKVLSTYLLLTSPSSSSRLTILSMPLLPLLKSQAKQGGGFSGSLRMALIKNAMQRWQAVTPGRELVEELVKINDLQNLLHFTNRHGHGPMEMGMRANKIKAAFKAAIQGHAAHTRTTGQGLMIHYISNFCLQHVRASSGLG